jgi:hypothetical protein
MLNEKLINDLQELAKNQGLTPKHYVLYVWSNDEHSGHNVCLASEYPDKLGVMYNGDKAPYAKLIGCFDTVGEMAKLIHAGCGFLSSAEAHDIANNLMENILN